LDLVPAESPSADAIKQLTTDYLAKRPATALHAGMSLVEARRAQSEFVTQLSTSWESELATRWA
jgi:hypothetical protein